MCGIAGLIDSSGRSGADTLAELVNTMSQTLRHRGPDDSGAWVDPEVGMALGHRRLAVIDLSENGHQPMTSACGRFVLVYNGEIYNHRDIRTELAASGDRFRGRSDTEVLLAALRRWGLRDALARCNGMFAFALWDRIERKLHLARDRFGEKPLYYGGMGSVFLFGSELKALKAHPSFDAEIDRGALTLFLQHSCVPSPWSIFRRVRKLPPGSILTIDAAHPAFPGQPKSYWAPSDVAARGAAEPLRLSEDDAVDTLEELLLDAVRLRLEADVPLGAFLSGGVDSSTVVALAQQQSAGPVRTFTMGSTDPEFDEAGHARRVARHLGTDHTELTVSPVDALSVVPRLPALYDEPFADPSQVPTFMVAELARKNVTVSLSGDGGDELFGGYNRHRWAPAVWRYAGWAPVRAREALGRSLLRVPPRTWEALAGVLPPRLRPRMPASKMTKLSGILAAESPRAMYEHLTSHWSHPDSVVIDGRDPLTLPAGESSWPDLPTISSQMMCLDQMTYLPDDILVKLDRATMAVSLEARVPLLDHRVAEFTARLPEPMRRRGASDRWLLRRVLYRYVPQPLIDRPKTGFSVPIADWLRDALRPWAEELLDPSHIRQEGFLTPGPIRQLWTEHLSGRRDHEYLLWDVLMFQAWLEQQ